MPSSWKPSSRKDRAPPTPPPPYYSIPGLFSTRIDVFDDYSQFRDEEVKEKNRLLSTVQDFGEKHNGPSEK
jgi:hypothetical protein